MIRRSPVFSFPLICALTLFFALLPNAVSGQRVLFEPGEHPALQEAIKAPDGFTRVDVAPGSFAQYLRKLPLYLEKRAVLEFDGSVAKAADDTSLAAVFAVDIKGCRLEQCMDILIRLHSDWLWSKGLSDSIQYPLPEGTILSWKAWRDGWRPRFKGLRFILEKGDHKQSVFEDYIRTIFEYSGTQTFYHHYPPQKRADLQPGDFIVKKGSRGHAVMIVDMARSGSGETVLLFAQGDTPACQPYLLRAANGSAWFRLEKNVDAPALPISKTMPWSGLRRFPKTH